jgi:SSS family solute:Na+ symporter
MAQAVFFGLCSVVVVLGFVAARWRRGDMSSLNEWGLGGRRFGTIITWFLLGGDLYTAYTFIAVPAAIFGQGAAGFFAVPYTILVYPVLFAVFPRLWAVSHAKGYVTAADFVRGRFGSGLLAAAIALTGIVATMPYIALQLVGIEVVLAAIGIHGAWPLVIAFAVLAAFTYSSGLRAPAIIALVKDTLIYITVAAAILVIPAELGGFAKIFAAIPHDKILLARPSAAGPGGESAYATLALGSALALFLYPHAMTGVLSASSRHVIRRNAVILPAYSLALGLIALLGTMAAAAHVATNPAFEAGFKAYGAQFAVPALFLQSFPGWFTGFAFAAIAIGALVPASIMAIASANLFTRSLYREYVDRDCAPARETAVAKLSSLAVMAGALFFVVALPRGYAIQLQLLGGIWIIQTLPSVLLGLYTRWLHPRALLLGWLAGIAAGTAMAAAKGFASAIFPLHLFGTTIPCYAAVSALALNLVVTLLLSALMNAVRTTDRQDETCAADYA